MLKKIGIIFAVIFGCTALTAIGWGVRSLMLAPRAINHTLGTAEGVIDKTLTADNAIYNYEWFKQQYEDIQAGQKKLDNAETNHVAYRASLPEDREDWTFEDKQEDARLNTIVLGLENNLEDMIADYNARAKQANRNIFEDGIIPDFIEIGSNFLK